MTRGSTTAISGDSLADPQSPGDERRFLHLQHWVLALLSLSLSRPRLGAPGVLAPVRFLRGPRGARRRRVRRLGAHQWRHPRRPSLRSVRGHRRSVEVWSGSGRHVRGRRGLRRKAAGLCLARLGQGRRGGSCPRTAGCGATERLGAAKGRASWRHRRGRGAPFTPLCTTHARRRNVALSPAMPRWPTNPSQAVVAREMGEAAPRSAEDVLGRINAFRRSASFDLVLLSLCQRQPGSGSRWPEHCIEGTHGADVAQGNLRATAQLPPRAIQTT